LGLVLPGHAAKVLRQHPYDLPCPPTMDTDAALHALASGGAGILVR
jgi:hypothetical protein